MDRGGKVAAQLNKIVEYLEDLGLMASRNNYPSDGFTIASVKKLSYVELWSTHIRNHWYDIRLDDNSLFFFFEEGSKVSYSFLGCPYICLPFSIYRTKEDMVDLDEGFIEELYEDYLGTTDINANPNYFRYDYDEKSYRPGEHPVAHLHCGLMDSVRFGLDKELDVMSFVAIVLRQMYVDKWSQVLGNKDDFHELYNHKANLNSIETQFYKALDKDQDFYLK